MEQEHIKETVLDGLSILTPPPHWKLPSWFLKPENSFVCEFCTNEIMKYIPICVSFSSFNILFVKFICRAVVRSSSFILIEVCCNVWKYHSWLTYFSLMDLWVTCKFWLLWAALFSLSTFKEPVFLWRNKTICHYFTLLRKRFSFFHMAF